MGPCTTSLVVTASMSFTIHTGDQGTYDDMGCTEGVPASLEVGGSFLCSPVLDIVQSDIDAGLVKNIARCGRVLTEAQVDTQDPCGIV